MLQFVSGIVGTLICTYIYDKYSKKRKKDIEKCLQQLKTEKKNIKKMRVDNDVFLRYSFLSLFRFIFLFALGIFVCLLTLFPSQVMNRNPDAWYIVLVVMSFILLVGSFQEFKSLDLIVSKSKSKQYFSRKKNKLMSDNDS